MTQTRRDPIQMELLKNAFTAICDEMAVTVVRTARSFVVREAMDFSTGLLNAEGELVAQGLCLPIHMGSLPLPMLEVIKEFRGDMQPGDVYVLNDPYVGQGSHLPDIYLFKPVFFNGELLGFVAAVAHHVDIGGRVPGGNACDNTEIFQEGLRIPPLKLFDRGQANEAIFKILRLNVRVPEKVIGDVMAEVAACGRGERGLLELAQRYGVERMKGYMNDLVDYAEELTRQELLALPEGEWDFEDFIDDDGFDLTPIRIYAKLIKKGAHLTVDLRGTGRQVKGSINMNHSFTRSCTYLCIRSILDPSTPNNAGFMRPIEVITEPGSIVDSVSPAPVAARGLTAMRTVETVFGALAKMLPQKVFACQVAANPGVTIGGYRPDGRPFVNLEFLYGSWGGSPRRDGGDSISSLASNYSNTPVEVVEREQPIRIERYALRPDSAGAGKHRGGLGVIRDYRLVEADEAVLQVRCDRLKFRPYGLWGGKPGGASENILNPQTEQARALPGKFMMTLKRGEVYRAALSGGGGWGDPLERDPGAVLDDVINEKVSADSARSDYGVVIDVRRMVVDHAATEELRGRMRQGRTP